MEKELLVYMDVRAGPVTRRVMKKFGKHVRDPKEGTPIIY